MLVNVSLATPYIYLTREADLNLNVEQGKVKAARLVGSSYRLAPTQKEAMDRKVNPQERTKKVISETALCINEIAKLVYDTSSKLKVLTSLSMNAFSDSY